MRRAEQVEWYAGFLRGEREILNENSATRREMAELTEHFSPEWRMPAGGVGQCELIRRANRRQPFTDSEISIDGSRIRLHDTYGHNWVLELTFDPSDRIAGIAVDIDLADGLKVRTAATEDLVRIEELDRATPMPFSDGQVVIDRNGQLTELMALLEPNDLAVAERNGEVLAALGRATVTIRVGGRRCEVNYMHHMRVAPPGRKQGLVPILAVTLETPTLSTTDGAISVVHADNSYAAKNQPFLWSAGGVRAVLDCASIAGAPIGSNVDDHDLQRLCSMINHAHENEEWFVPYSPTSLAERLGRTLNYGVANLVATKRAVVGLWPSGERRVYRSGGDTWDERRGTVLDYGFAEGGLDELELLLRQTAASAHEAGITHLSIFTAEGAPTYPMIAGLTDRLEPYVVSCSIPEPANAAQRGVYIDPILA